MIFDVLVAADFRAGDTGAERHAALAGALAQAGYALGLVPWLGSAAAEPARPIPAWAELLRHPGVRRVGVDAEVRARLLIAPDLRQFAHHPRPLAATADRRLGVASRGFAAGPQAARGLLEVASEALGGAVELAASASPMRALLQSLAPDAPVAGEDWPPVVAAAAAHGADAPARVCRAAIGYYRASVARGWPEPSRLLAALPPHPMLQRLVYAAPDGAVAALRGAGVAAEFWSAEAASPQEFLRALDLLVSDAAAEDDPHPEEVLQALAVGTVPLLPQGFGGTFLAAAAYAASDRVAETALDLFVNPELMDDISAAGAELIERQLAPERAAERVEALIGPAGRRSFLSRSLALPERRVLALSTNGVGMGHLARQLAIATRLDRHLETVFLGFSQAVHTVRDFGDLAEYLPPTTARQGSIPSTGTARSRTRWPPPSASTGPGRCSTTATRSSPPCRGCRAPSRACRCSG